MSKKQPTPDHPFILTSLCRGTYNCQLPKSAHLPRRGWRCWIIGKDGKEFEVSPFRIQYTPIKDTVWRKKEGEL